MYTVEDLSVLVVEPSHMQRRIILKAFRDACVTTLHEANDGAMALRMLFDLSPDLVVSSLYLPDTTGTDLVRTIRHSSSHSDTAFMLISSETRFRYLDPIRQAGSVGILPKPFTHEQLRVALTSTLDLIDPEHISLAQQNATSLRVLVVDDSSLARKHIARVLAAMEVPMENIDYAENGEQALDLVNSNYYDFVISDYNMPVMDGMELVDRIRNSSNQCSIPVLMVTSETDENRLAAVQRAGVSAICDKPFEPAMVHRLIHQILEE